MADIEQSVGVCNVSSRRGYAYAFTLDYPASEGNVTADTFVATLYNAAGVGVALTVTKGFTTFTRLTISLAALDAATAGEYRWECIRTTNLVPAPEFEGEWKIE
jgi:hypothetical protein